MLTHAVPTDPGRSRLFFAMLQPSEKAAKAMKLLLPLMQLPWLRFRAHFGQHNVLDGDSVFLHHQARPKTPDLPSIWQALYRVLPSELVGHAKL